MFDFENEITDVSMYQNITINSSNISQSANEGT